MFHVAGLIPNFKIKDKNQYWKHNVEATRILVEECLKILNVESGFKGFIFTSSSDVIKGTRDLAGLDERASYPKTYFDTYSESKVRRYRPI